jgi:hypothetical protein
MYYLKIYLETRPDGATKCLTQYRTDRIWGWKIKFGHLERKRESAMMKSHMLLNVQVPDMEKRIIVAQPYNC